MVLTLVAATARADAPQLIPVQGFLTDSAGKVVDGSTRLDFLLYARESGGDALFVESHRSVEVDDGQFVVYLGSQGEELDLALFRDNPEVWLEIVVNSTDIISPRVRLASLPYAAFAQYCGEAQTALTVGELEVSDLQQALDDDCAAGSALQSIDPDGSVTCASYADAIEEAVESAACVRRLGTWENGACVEPIKIVPHNPANAITSLATLRECADRTDGYTQLASANELIAWFNQLPSKPQSYWAWALGGGQRWGFGNYSQPLSCESHGANVFPLCVNGVENRQGPTGTNAGTINGQGVMSCMCWPAGNDSDSYSVACARP